MSETDSFIQEVTEEVRQDRMFALWKKWGPLVLTVVLVAVGGAALWSWMEARAEAEAEARGGVLLGAEPGVLDEQKALVVLLEPPTRTIAEFGVAAALAEAGQTGEAAAAYRALAAQSELERHYRDLALLQALRIEAADGDTAVLLAELAPLTEARAPYAPLARELAAVLHLRAGDRDAARGELEAILSDDTATQALRLRARELMALAAEPAEGAG